MKCAFMNRECNPECVAWVPTEGGDPREGYHFTFPCIRLDSMYDMAAALWHIQETIKTWPLEL
jgi:hypothetical protein